VKKIDLKYFEVQKRVARIIEECFGILFRLFSTAQPTLFLSFSADNFCCDKQVEQKRDIYMKMYARGGSMQLHICLCLNKVAKWKNN